MRVLEAAPPFGLDNLKIADRPTPEPGPFEVLVRMRAVSLNYRDLLSVLGGYGRQVQQPVVPLSDGCGVIEKIGPGVTRVKVGDRVSTLFFQRWIAGVPTMAARASALGSATEAGAARDYAVFNENGVSKVPDYLTDEQVATLACAGLTAWRALFEDARLEPRRAFVGEHLERLEEHRAHAGIEGHLVELGREVFLRLGVQDQSELVVQ